MSDGTHVARVEIEGSVGGADKNVRRLEKQIVQLEKALQQNEKALERNRQKGSAMGASMLDVGSKIAMVGMGFQQLKSAVDQYSQRALAVSSVARNFKGDIEGLSAATGGLISNFDLMRLQNSALAMGVVNSAEAFQSYARAAQTLGARVGMDAASSIESLNAAIGRGSTEMLDNLGIVLKQSEAQAEYAARIGKTASQLTEAEKKQAFQTIAMERVVEAAGEAEAAVGGVGSGLQRLSVFIQNTTDDLLRLDQHLVDFAIEAHHAAEAGSTLGVVFDALTFGAGGSTLKLRELQRELKAANQRLEDAYSRVDNLSAGLRQMEADWDAVVFKHGTAAAKTEVAFKNIFVPGAIAAGDAAMDFWTDVRAKKAEVQEKTKQELYGTLVDTFAGGGAAAMAKDKPARRGGRARRQGDFLDQFKPDSFLDPNAADDLEAEFLAEETRLLAEKIEATEREYELRQLNAEAALQSLGADELRLDLVKQAIETEFEGKQRIIDMEREALEARGYVSEEDERETKARLAQLTHEREMNAVQQRMAIRQAEVQHQQKVAEQERRILEAKARAIQSYQNFFSDVWGGMTQTVSMGLQASRMEAEKAERIERALRAGQLYVQGAFYIASGTAAIIAGNYIDGAQKIAGGTFALAQAGIMSGGGSLGGMTGGRGASGGSSRAEAPPPALRGGQERQAPGSAIPGSREGMTGRRALPAAMGGGANITIGEIKVLGAIDKQTATKLKQELERVGYSGRVNA